MSSDRLFLGLDSSTQGLKAAVIDSSLKVVHSSAVNFDKDLPEFETEGGAHHYDDGLTVTSPSIMWVAAMDMLFEKMKAADAPLGQVVAISGSGQQHGSVWLKNGARAMLQGLDPAKPLREQMEEAFSVADSPIWMDSSTTEQCLTLEEALGGPQKVADLTGSRAYERFTGNQIAKIHQQSPEKYEATQCISLVSSFIASMLVGDYAPIDASDGSGMNLMNIRTKKWVQEALDCCAPGLSVKLGDVVPSHTPVGKLHAYYVKKYGFDPACMVVAFSGDNPNSLAGLRLQKAGDIAISLGTSDTIFGFLAEPKPSASEGHIFANPVDPSAYMALVCYKNGSLTREHVRDKSAKGSWEEFRNLMTKTEPGNGGNIGFYIKEPEITPPILKTGMFRFDPSGNPVESFAAEIEVRAVLEGQFLSMRTHCANIGIKPASILATGGASVDKAVIRVMTDVFGVPVFVGDQPDSAALGSAYRALHGWRCVVGEKFVPFADTIAGAPEFKKAADPDKAAHEVYTGMLEKYSALEKKVMAG